MKKYPIAFIALVDVFRKSKYFRGEETVQEDFKKFLIEEVIKTKDSL